MPKTTASPQIEAARDIFIVCVSGVLEISKIDQLQSINRAYQHLHNFIGSLSDIFDNYKVFI